ncbi:MAG TPA: hypothetical protein PL041_06910 [Melioribacteraceae bacterium]|nr:hypothetical protein [Melioribacteraceae bacterium]
MKTIFYILIIGMSLINAIFASSLVGYDDLQFLRTTYYSAVENEDDVDKLEKFIQKKYGMSQESYPPIVLAYIAGIEALKSKHSFWITTKYKYLVKSMDIFEKAVNKSPNDLEIRFMRFSILHYVPGIVGYSKEKESDLTMVYNLLIKQTTNDLPKDIRMGMAQFLIDSDRLENKQIEELNKLKIELAKL